MRVSLCGRKRRTWDRKSSHHGHCYILRNQGLKFSYPRSNGVVIEVLQMTSPGQRHRSVVGVRKLARGA